MLDSGVVSESTSPWAATIVLVKKKDGSWRFCVDCRKLNVLMYKDAYPLPRIEESLTGLRDNSPLVHLDTAPLGVVEQRWVAQLANFKDINPGDHVKDALLEEMLAVPEEHRDEGEGAMHASTAGEGEGASAPAPAPKKLISQTCLEKEKTFTPVPRRIRVDTELARYLQEEALDSHSDPLARWWENQARFLLLLKVARKYMTVCATSTPSECVFSTAGNIVTPFRSSLKPDKVNMLVCLARNMKTEK
ncbi:hypothetical protein AOLI_G00099830 [Acnodon oligacanthus]